jgi:hypothetical protein
MLTRPRAALTYARSAPLSVVSHIRRDPVVWVAAIVIVAGTAWRAWVVKGGFLAADDLVLAARSLDSGVIAFLFSKLGAHLVPGEMVLYWAFTRWFGLEYWPYLAFVLLCTALASIILFRLLRRILRPGWALLIPLALATVSPITLEASSWMATAMGLAPMQLAMVWALAAQVAYIETRRKRHLANLAGAFAFGLFFYEKALLIAPLIVIFTICLFTTGGPLASVISALKRYWRSFAVVGAVGVAYLVLWYVTPEYLGHMAIPGPASLREVWDFGQLFFGYNLLPGLFGGPVDWIYAGEGGPALGTQPIFAATSFAATAAIVAITVARRKSAARAWVMVLLYALCGFALIAYGRLGLPFGAIVGLGVRYTSDIVSVAAIGLGVALNGLRGEEEAERRTLSWSRSRLAFATRVVTIGALLLAIGAATAVSGARYADLWSIKKGRDYVRTAQADFSAMPEGIPVLDLPVPQEVIVFWLTEPRYRQQSSLFAAAKVTRPKFVSAGEHVYLIAVDGHVRPAAVKGFDTKPGPTGGGCGWFVRGETGTIPLDIALFPWPWAVHIGYFASADTTATLRFGGTTRDFPVKQGLHEYLMPMGGGGDSFQLTLHDPEAGICVDKITVGVLNDSPTVTQ